MSVSPAKEIVAACCNGSDGLELPNGSFSMCTGDCPGSSRLAMALSQSPQFRMSPTTSIDGKSPPSGGGTDSPPLDSSTIPRRLRLSSSMDLNDAICLDVKNESKVLVLYTGGTIGMVRNSEGALAPQPHAMESMIRANFTMHDEKYSSLRFSDNRDLGEVDKSDISQRENGIGNKNGKRDTLLPLVLPQVPNHKRVIYTIYEYDPLLDSSNMTMDDWIQISRDIKHSYELFDGFVILHGTDTLGYTASALSFMLENLGKPVIITGSQIPCFETRSDGRDNFVGALILAGNYNIPEVGVYFRHNLLRGNRTVKVSSGDLDAFHSPNMNPLVKAGIDFDVDYKAIHRPHSIKKFSVHTRLNRNVVLLRLFPSIRSDTIAHFLAPPIEGVVMQCYGAGNVPNNRKDLMEAIKEAADRGVIILSVTQCVNGGVSGLYETGKALLDAGVIPGGDITPEAALTKLSYVLSKTEWTLEEKRHSMMSNLRGEMTVLNVKEISHTRMLEDGDDDDIAGGGSELELIQAVAKSLSIKTSDELEGVEAALFPAILCSAVFKGSLDTLEAMRTNYGADLTAADYDKRTPLHVAASEGNLEMVEYLLRHGASVHARDRHDDSPLSTAIHAGNKSVIELLVRAGAHLNMSNQELGEILCFLARKGDLNKIQCYRLAGANLNCRNMTGNTALHAAAETGQLDMVNFLLSSGARANVHNAYGQTPAAIATVLRRVRILDMLKEATSHTQSVF